MKLLLDTCIWGGAADELRMRGHDVIWSGDWDEDPGDEEILTTALAQGRILITLDKDFGELAVVRRGLCFEPGPASWKHAIPRALPSPRTTWAKSAIRVYSVLQSKWPLRARSAN